MRHRHVMDAFRSTVVWSSAARFDMAVDPGRSRAVSSPTLGLLPELLKLQIWVAPTCETTGVAPSYRDIFSIMLTTGTRHVGSSSVMPTPATKHWLLRPPDHSAERL